MDGHFAEDVRVGTYELSVMFIDVRGYSSYAELRSPAEVFEVLSHYARNVIDIVTSCGGSVLELNGDGILVAFGYPTALRNKECAALSAALRIVRSRDSTMGLSVGVGIATGTVYVGSIHAAGRAFWGATGDTTNLAARLQCLARELDASVVIDSTTFDRARAQAAEFEAHPQTAIRGRLRTEDVFFLSHGASLAA
jgi:adenylate cyclase